MATSSSHSVIDRATIKQDDLPHLSSPLISPLGRRLYKAQFAPLYDFRLRKLRKRVMVNAKAKWEHADKGALATKVATAIKGKGKSAAATDVDENSSQSRRAPPAGSADFSSSQPTITTEDGDEDEESSLATLLKTEKPQFVQRILDIEQGKIAYIIGTAYCSMPMKPDVLEDLTREQWLPPQPIRTKYFDAVKDELYLEDESGRVKLVGRPLLPYSQGGNNLRNEIVTGVVVAALGTETKDGDFEVVDLVFPEGGNELLSHVPETSIVTHLDQMDTLEETGDNIDDNDDPWIAIVSGLEVGADQRVPGEDREREDPSGRYNSELKLLLLSEWLSGELDDQVGRNRTKNIVSLVLAGNSFAKPVKSEEESHGTRKTQTANEPVSKEQSPAALLDRYLSDICSSLPVYLLPGEQDPAPVVLPQQPIHHALLPKASRWSQLKRQTNPAWFGIEDKKILATSGQTLDDIFKYMEDGQDSRLRMAMQTLRWGHVAPTAPDTLWCIPFTDSDPFLISERPDLYLIGNQPIFATGVYPAASAQKSSTPTRVVLVPKFSETGQVVLVNLKTLACRLETIDVSL